MADAVPTKRFVRTALTGGTVGCLDAIDGAELLEGYTCDVVLSTFIAYKYRLNATSGAAESSPDTISPDTNAGTKRWVLQGIYVTSVYATGNISALTFTDRTPYYDGDALSDIAKIKGKDGLIDHDTLPSFTVVTKEIDGEVVAERDLGAMISVLTLAIQQLLHRIELIETSAKNCSEVVA